MGGGRRDRRRGKQSSMSWGLSIRSKPGTVLDAGDSAGSMTDEVPAPGAPVW